MTTHPDPAIPSPPDRRQAHPNPARAVTGAALGFTIAMASSGCVSTDNRLTDWQPEARDALERMSDQISAADQISFTAVLTSVERGGTPTHSTSTHVVIDRPNKVYASESDGSGVLSEFFFDGSTVTLVSHPSRTFANTGHPSSIDEALDMSSRKFGLDSPLALVVRRDPFAQVTRFGGSGRVVGTETHRGVPCDIFTFASHSVAWTAWISQHDGLPLRLAARSNEEIGMPTHYAEIYDWKLDSRVSLDRFDANVPAGYQEVNWRSAQGGDTVE